jgi:hypothetical protein
VGEHVAIGMGDRTLVKRDRHSTQNELAARNEAVDVIAKANPERVKAKG